MCYNAAELCAAFLPLLPPAFPKESPGPSSSSHSLSVTITTPPVCQILCTGPDCHLTSKPDNTIPRVIAAWEFRGVGRVSPGSVVMPPIRRAWRGLTHGAAETVRRIAVLTTGQCHTPEWMLAPFLEGREELQCSLGGGGFQEQG